jgi:hypothetical protein
MILVPDGLGEIVADVINRESGDLMNSRGVVNSFTAPR